MQEYQHIQRKFGPVFNSFSKILILGSFPSAKSREANFYYGHPQNRFWPLLARILQCNIPVNTEEKKNMLLSRGIALWDVLDSCDIIGSSDSSIKNAVPVDIMAVLNNANIQQIFCCGGTAYSLFMKYLEPVCKIKPIQLPSTSPANASWSLDRLYRQWKQIKDFI